LGEEDHAWEMGDGPDGERVGDGTHERGSGRGCAQGCGCVGEGGGRGVCEDAGMEGHMCERKGEGKGYPAQRGGED
jgi:hypothetical protein